jgi:hypothetical protein
MRVLRVPLAISILFLSTAAPARAALLSLLGSSTLDVRVGRLGGEHPLAYFGAGSCFGQTLYPSFPPIQFQSNQPVALVPLAPGGGFVEPAGLFTGTQMQSFPGVIFTVTPSGAFCSASQPVAAFDRFTIANVSNGTKSIAPGAAGGGQGSGIVRPGGGLGGRGALAGTVFVNVLGLFNLEIPLAPVGSTGASGQAVAGSLAATVLGTGWTTGTVQVTGVTTSPTDAGPVYTVTFAGYDDRTPGHAGRVLLVSPFKVVTNFAGNLPGIALQTLDFAAAVPEPGTLGLLATAVATLAVIGVRRRRG